MRQKLFFALILILTLPASARIGSIDLEHLVNRSDFIAVVDVTRVRHPNQHEQVASFQSIRVLKGSLRDGHRLYRGHKPRCALESYSPGRYLLFLKRENDYLVAAYHVYSVFEVAENKLDWFEAPSSKRRQEASLQRAEADIRRVLSGD